MTRRHWPPLHQRYPPGAPEFRHYLPPGQFAQQFGPTASIVATVRTTLLDGGLASGPLSVDHLSMSVEGTTAQIGRVFSTSFVQYQLGDGQVCLPTRHLPAWRPPLRPTSRPSWDSTTSPLRDLRVGLGSGVPSGLAAPQAAGTPKACASATSAAKSFGADTMSQIAGAYAFSKLYDNRDLGAGETVGIIELARYSAPDVASLQTCSAPKQRSGR